MSDALAALAARVEQAPYVTRLGLAVDSIALDRVVVRVPYKDENSNPGRALHGGVAASTIDVAGVLAAWTGLPDGDAEHGTLDLSVTYLAAAIGEDIMAEAQVLRRGKEIVYADVDVRNAGGKRIAKGLVTHRALPRSAEPAPERQQLAHTDPPVEGGDVPSLARVIVSVPFMASLGLAITHMKDGRAVVRMPCTADKTDGSGAIHEGALAALLDTTGAMAAWSVAGLDLRYKASTVGIHASFHAPAVDEDMVAEGRTWRRNNEIFLNQVTVSGARSRTVVATGSVTYRIVT